MCTPVYQRFLVSELKYTFPNTFLTARSRVSRNLKGLHNGDPLSIINQPIHRKHWIYVTGFKVQWLLSEYWSLVLLLTCVRTEHVGLPIRNSRLFNAYMLAIVRWRLKPEYVLAIYGQSSLPEYLFNPTTMPIMMTVTLTITSTQVKMTTTGTSHGCTWGTAVERGNA